MIVNESLVDAKSDIRNTHQFKTKLLLMISFLLFSAFSTTEASSGNKTAFTPCDGVSTFTCITDNRCIHKDLVCNGIVECEDGSDEIICSNNKCEGSFWFKCSNQHCVAKTWVCDGSNDCQDWSDEQDCPSAPGVEDVEDHCKHGEFRCNSGICIQKSWVCDGEDDCKDKEDEDLTMCVDMALEKRTCTQEEFTCKNGNCIPHSWVCDGTQDCLDGSDEIKDECNSRLSGACDQHEGRFQCHDHSFCLDPHLVCNGKADCTDSSDEGTFCNNTPSCHTIDCSRGKGCIRKEDGPVCFCEEGRQMIHGQCQDRDECQDYGSCSQNCHNTNGSYFCSCNPGYKENVNSWQKASCLAIGAEPVLYFATKIQVRGLNLRSETYFPVARDLDNVVGVGYDGVEGRAYWTSAEDGKEMIVSSRRDNHFRKNVVTRGLDMPEDIAVDEISRNIYLTDSKKKHVAVCKLDGSACAVLAQEEVDMPRAIGLHIPKKLAVYSDWGEKSAIVIMGMDGSNRRNLVDKDLAWPNGIAIDVVLDRIFWSDAKKNTIESIKLDGTDRRPVLDQKVMHPFSLAVFEDTLYWSDWLSMEIKSCNKFTGKDEKVLLKEANIRPMGVSVYHPIQNENIANPCINNRCSHLCLPRPQDGIGPSGQSHTCACPAHLTLDKDEATCIVQSQSHYLVVSTGNQLYRVVPRILGRNSFHLLGSLNDGMITSFTTDTVLNKIYVEDKMSRNVHQLDVQNKRWSRMSVGGDLGEIVVDRFAGNLYWIDTAKSSIMVQSLETEAKKSIVENLRNPTSLIFLPHKNILVFTEVIPFFHDSSLSSITTGRVSTCNMDGTDLKEVEILTGMLTRPIALTYHHDENTLYIADPGRSSIIKWVVGTHQAGVFINSLNEVVSMAVNDGHIYWLELGSNNLFWASLEDKAMKEVNWMSLDSIVTIQVPGQNLMRLGVFSDIAEFGDIPRPCLSHHCSHMCFADGKGELGWSVQSPKAHCDCPFGMIRSKNLVDCEEDCPENTFKCGNSKCIHPNWVCDGEDDCFNGQDEVGCSNSSNKTADACPGRAKCDDSTCIAPVFWCDGDRDCLDGSDEKDCPVITCLDGKFKCKNANKCVPKNWRCDGENDCEDGSDEENCRGCQENEFECAIDKVCIEKKWMCDGRPDCMDASDESNCHFSTECPDGFFKCDNDNCVDFNLACDGHDDCGDGSDEYRGVCPHELRNELEEMIDCDSGFQCDNACLPEVVRCNGTAECTNNADEMYCSVCTSDTFRCNDGEQCIREEWLCDDTEDCSDGSDEKDCDLLRSFTPKMSCGVNQYMCKTSQCIGIASVCNGIIDCEDGSDEHQLHCQMCQFRNGGCPHICVPTPDGPMCKCRPGYVEKFVDGVDLCEDADECQSLTSCAQHCDNTKGGFKCSCNESYVAEEEGRLCRAKGEATKLVYASMSNILGKEIESSHQKVLLEFDSHGSPVRSFDLNFATGELYWTSPTMGVIGKQQLSKTPSKNRIHIFMKNIDKPDQVAVDWVTNNIYFSRQGSRDIVVCSSAADVTGHCRKIVEIVPSTATHLALDPAEGVMFVAGHSRRPNAFPEGGIWVYGMDGKALTGVGRITGSKVGMPSGLTLDLVMKRVFLSDYTKKQISMCGYRGENFQVVTKAKQTHPSWVSLFESRLYWISGSEGKVYSHDLVADVHIDQPSINILPNSHSLKFAQESRQPKLQNPCLQLNCAGMCLIGYGGQGVCACPMGQTPKDSASVNCISSSSDSDSPSLVAAKPGDSVFPKSANATQDGAVQHVLLNAAPSSRVYGAVAGVIVVLILLILIGIFAVYFVRYRKSKAKLCLLRYENPMAGFEPNESGSNHPEGMSEVKVERYGTTTAVENPGFETPDHHTGHASGLEFYRPAMPIISTPDWPVTPSTPAILKAKGCSTPNMGREGQKDGICRLPTSYEDSLDYNLSVSFSKDKDRLISSDCEM